MVMLLASWAILGAFGTLVMVAASRRQWTAAVGAAVGAALVVALAPATCVVFQSYGGSAQCTNVFGLTTRAAGASGAGSGMGVELAAASPLLLVATVAAIVTTVVGRRLSRR